MLWHFLPLFFAPNFDQVKPMRIVTAREWGARIIQNGELPTRAAQGIVIHHTASPNRTPLEGEAERAVACKLARTIQEHHRTARPGKPAWRDSGHHFLVSRGGLILEGRCGSADWAETGRVLQGAHCGNGIANQNRFGIEIEGTYTSEGPPAVQWDAVVELAAYLSLWGAFQSADILGHRTLRATLCPGDLLFSELPRLKAAVKTRKLVLLSEGR